jgi:hypothetical protein
MTTSKLLPVTLCAAAALAGTAATQASAAPTLKLGVYDCEFFNFSTGTLQYQSSVKLLAGHKYQHAFNRHHATLEKPSSGTYSVSGTKVKFKGGGLGKLPGKIVKTTGGGSPHIALYMNGKSTGTSCYFVSHP